MTTDENIMEEMLERATNPSRETIDELSLQMFCMVVRSNPKLVDRAQELIILKIRSNNVTESTRSINLLEECMAKCGPEFQDEASKFRFLNQLIRLVSKKYLGADTPIPIKKRIMECLLLWTTEFPLKAKIKEVYEMLCKEGGVDFSTTLVIEGKNESVLGIDEDMLSKLIKSNDPENFKRANLLIQSRVKQDTRRMDLMVQNKNILNEVTNTVNVLDEMLNIYESEGRNDDIKSDTISLMRELYHACKKHKPILERLPALMENLDETLIVDAIEKNYSLQNVIHRYKILVGSPTTKITASTAFDTDCSVTSSKSVEMPHIQHSNADLLSDLLENGSNVTTTSTRETAASQIKEIELMGATANLPIGKVTPANPLDELHSLFNASATSNIVVPGAAKNANDVFSNFNILEPITVFPTSNLATSDDGSNDISKTENTTEKGAYRKLPAIDKLSEDLLQASLQDLERVYSFKKGPEKQTLNTLAKERATFKTISSSPLNTPTKSGEQGQQRMDDELILDVSSRKDDDDLVLSTKFEYTEAEPSSFESRKKLETIDLVAKNPVISSITHLADIEVDLDEIEPVPGDPLLLADDDIKLVLNFTKNRPSKQVSVIVISAINNSKLPTHDFQFEASVHKPCKVRLLQPTAVRMPPCKPFRPSSPINQVMLLLNPTGKPIDVTCILGYKLGDDPDPIKESIVAKDIPYVE